MGCLPGFSPVELLLFSICVRGPHFWDYLNIQSPCQTFTQQFFGVTDHFCLSQSFLWWLPNGAFTVLNRLFHTYSLALLWRRTSSTSPSFTCLFIPTQSLILLSGGNRDALGFLQTFPRPPLLGSAIYPRILVHFEWIIVEIRKPIGKLHTHTHPTYLCIIHSCICRCMCLVSHMSTCA